MDRLAEEDEDFLTIDRKKVLALRKKQLSPVILNPSSKKLGEHSPTESVDSLDKVVGPKTLKVMQRTIVGNPTLFNQGFLMK